MKTITKRQQEILDYIIECCEVRGLPPTRRDITDYFKFQSPNAADEHLKALERKGFIDLIPRTSRGISLKVTPSAFLPIIGRVAAGSPIEAQESLEGQSNISRNFFKPTANYLLRVQGDSMINAGINDGDLLAVHKTTEVWNNDIVVARVDGEVTVKRFRRVPRRHYRIQLIPENEKYQTMDIDENVVDFSVEGRGVGLIRMAL